MSLKNWDQFYEKRLDLELDATSRATPEEDQRVVAPFEKDATLELLEVRAESRWSNTLECLAKNFHAEIFNVCGREVKKSLLIIGHASYNVRAHYFNQKIFDYSGQNLNKKIALENLSHNAEKLIRDTAAQLDAQFLKRLNPRVQPGPVLFASEMKVSYENEPGEGSGVVRAFFSSFAEALMTLRKLPQGTSLQEKQDDYAEPNIDDNAPLFYQMSTGQKVFSMCPGNGTPKRFGNFRNVGRIFGLALVQKQVLPLSLPRHVWKAIAAGETSFSLSFHDLAFVDYELYMRLRELIMERKDEKALTEKLNHLELYFTCVLPKEETDGKTPREVELCPGGKEKRVTSSNLPEYVYQLVKCRLGRPELQQCYASFAQGIHDVVPAGFLSHLTAEDLALLANGVAEIPIDRLKKLTTFQEECQISQTDLKKLERWFWEIVDRFSDKEKQDLICFWTGSATLPALDEMFVARPTIVIKKLVERSLTLCEHLCFSSLHAALHVEKHHVPQTTPCHSN